MSLSEVAQRLADENDLAAYEAIMRALHDPTTRGPALEALRGALSSPRPSSRVAFVLSRKCLEEGDLATFESLSTHPASAVRSGAIESIWGSSAIAADAQARAMSSVRRALEDEAAEVRAMACWALKGASSTGIDVTPLLGLLIERLSDDDPKVRFDATWAAALLGRSELDLSPHLRLLVDRLQDSYVYTREAAAKALWYAARRGVDITSGRAALRKAAKQRSDKQLQKSATGALAALERLRTTAPGRRRRQFSGGWA
jgi:HEAT repeats